MSAISPEEIRGGLAALWERALTRWTEFRRLSSRFWRIVALYLPKGLYPRSLIIVIAPMILLQTVRGIGYRLSVE